MMMWIDGCTITEGEGQRVWVQRWEGGCEVSMTRAGTITVRGCFGRPASDETTIHGTDGVDGASTTRDGAWEGDTFHDTTDTAPR